MDRERGRRFVVRISGSCWQSEYDLKRGWFNLVCANERKFPELTRVFMELENYYFAPTKGGGSRKKNLDEDDTNDFTKMKKCDQVEYDEEKNEFRVV